jgi:hypothetical protein
MIKTILECHGKSSCPPAVEGGRVNLLSKRDVPPMGTARGYEDGERCSTVSRRQEVRKAGLKS